MSLQKIETVAARIYNDILQREEYEAVYLAGLPKCKKCGEPVDLRYESCRNCAALAWKAAAAVREAAQERERDIRRLGGLKAYENFTLENYDNKGLLSMCEGWPGINLYIWGPAGVGKTHLATAIARNYREAQVIKPQHISRTCRGLKDGDEEQAAVDKFINMPYLVVDDLGIGSKTDFSFSILYEIIDSRDMACRNGLIVTCNLALSALADRLADDRIVSRLAGMCRVVKISGTDRRIK